MTEALSVTYAQERITPFWQKLPFFFLFPFRIGPLVFLACLAGASAVAGLVIGPFGLVFKGTLLYLGLRYGFNVLDLFAKGRFEGESVDYTLWGPERRPAKLGLVIVLFVALAATLGNLLVDARVAKDAGAQAKIIARYQQEHAADLAQMAQDRQAFNKRVGIESTPAPAVSTSTGHGEAASANSQETRSEETDDDAEPAASGAEPGAGTNSNAGPNASAADAGNGAITRNASGSTAASDHPAPGSSMTRAEILEAYAPSPGDSMWLALLPPWYWVMVIALSLLLPAAALVIALDDAFFRALNPMHALRFIGTMGGAYFVLWAFFLLIAGARQWVLTAGANWSPALRLPAELGLGTYLALVLCALMGYVLYQFHQELRLDVEVDFDTHRKAGGSEAIARAGSVQAALRKSEPQDPLERKLQALVAEGKVAEAIAELKDQMRYARLDPALNQRLHELYVLQGDNAVTLSHGQQWLASLATARPASETLSALRKLLAIDPAFTIAEGSVVLPAASAASKQGDHELAVRLLKGFDKRFPQHTDTAGVYFLGARLMSEYQRQHDKAARLLRGILAHYPDYVLASDVQTYLTVLERSLGKP